MWSPYRFRPFPFENEALGFCNAEGDDGGLEESLEAPGIQQGPVRSGGRDGGRGVMDGRRQQDGQAPRRSGI